MRLVLQGRRVKEIPSAKRRRIEVLQDSDEPAASQEPNEVTTDAVNGWWDVTSYDAKVGRA